MDEIVLKTLADSLFDFLIISRNSVTNGDEFLKTFLRHQNNFKNI